MALTAGWLLLAFLSTPLYTRAERPDGTAGAFPAELAEEVILALYGFDFQTADMLSSSLLSEHPDHYIAHFARVYYYWWMMVADPQPEKFEQAYRRHIMQAIPLARQALDREPDHAHAFFFINLHAMAARLDLQQGAWIRTMKNLRHCVVQVERSMGLEKEFPGFYLTSGLYNYMTVQAARRYPFLRLYSLLYPEGNRETGITQLREAFRSDYPLWKTEAGYFLMRIFLDEEHDPERAEAYASWLTETYPANLVFQYYHLQVLLAMGNEAAAISRKREIERMALQHPTLSQAQRNHFLKLVNPR